MRLRVFFRSKFGFIGASVRRCAEAHLPCPGGRLRGFFLLQVRLGRRKRAPARRSAPSVPGRAVAGIFFLLQVRLGRRKRAFRAREGGCGDFFSFQVRLGRRKRAFRARAGGCGAVFRSKFGFIGASVRRCAEAHLPCPGGRLRGFFSLQVRLHRRKHAPVRRSAPSVPGRAVAGIFFAPSSASSEQAGAGAQKRAFRAREGGCEDFFSLQVRLGRRKGRRCAEARLPCMGGRLRGFFFAPSSAWSEQACAGAQKRAFRARAGGCGAVFRYTACTEGFVIPNLIRNICLRMHG
ncbi:hypothetical protein TRSA_15990 [Treponema saccharophilum]|nr:hypothetical protein TRSA_15990 [Treponema saccharophilum]